ncbi:flagellar biosynthesis protein FliQ [Acetatifactor muris]|jgi:flagellar biosynthetic protein FliQ|uniref:Flagellar biosynthetic protein FliQ n=1 Tax=Acetatifactor muris TaxID=879566 RepID=A0A2K4ZIL9_9FIRM|nr:flagellar biosynthesis protein FliQ [Acetatifactor muris]MCR2048636.1 flagellar biosynthesis protein FliQ [Acetatifactor muris]SOY30304.1 Flagellar biosynthetic protein FliQ [Acetatifactor muris]
MTVDVVMDITRQALFLIIKVSLPVLLVSLCVGLAVSIFQTVTSIQEQTLTFVPKIICVFLALILFGNWMMNSMVEFMNVLWSDFGLYINR